MVVGDFVVYTGGGVMAPDLHFGYIVRLNESTDKIWIEQTTWDRQPKMKQRYDHSSRSWVDGDEPVGVSLVNHTQWNRFWVH